jgi:hypothetical protein
MWEFVDPDEYIQHPGAIEGLNRWDTDDYL